MFLIFIVIRIIFHRWWTIIRERVSDVPLTDVANNSRSVPFCVKACEFLLKKKDFDFLPHLGDFELQFCYTVFIFRLQHTSQILKLFYAN